MKQIVVFFIGFFLTLAILDWFVRLAYVENTSPTDFTEQYGRCRVANKDFVYFNEGFGIGRFNEGRYLGNYYTPQKPDNVIRIAALGDSYVEGFQVFERDHFLTLLEGKLNESRLDSFQVLNFGRSGFDFGDMYAYYERIVKPYDCDIVLFFVSNADLNIQQTDPLIPRVQKTQDGKLIITNEEFPKIYLKNYLTQKMLAHRSTIFQMLNNSRKLVIAGELNHKLFDKFAYMFKEENRSKSTSDIPVADLSFNIIDYLVKEKPDFYIINRDNRLLNNTFTDALPSQIHYIDLYSNSKLYKSNKDYHFWKATKKSGHWIGEGHKIVSEYLFDTLNHK